MIIQVPDTKKIQKLSKNPIYVNEGFFNEPTQKQEISGASMAAQKGATYMRKLAEEAKIPEIEKFLKYYDITNYEIECTGKGIFVDVNDNLYLPNKKLTGFPGFKFRYVQGTCNFSGNRFTDFSQFPRRIEKSCMANFNYIKSFQNAPEYIGGNLIATKQKVKPIYPLTKENYEKFINGEDLLENRIWLVKEKEYGTLININEKENNCHVQLDNGDILLTETTNVDCLGLSIKFLL